MKIPLVRADKLVAAVVHVRGCFPPLSLAAALLTSLALTSVGNFGAFSLSVHVAARANGEGRARASAPFFLFVL